MLPPPAAKTPPPIPQGGGGGPAFQALLATTEEAAADWSAGAAAAALPAAASAALAEMESSTSLGVGVGVGVGKTATPTTTAGKSPLRRLLEEAGWDGAAFSGPSFDAKALLSRLKTLHFDDLEEVGKGSYAVVYKVRFYSLEFFFFLEREGKN
jgi:hypothetical protein